MSLPPALEGRQLPAKGHPENTGVPKGSKATGGLESKMYGFKEGRHSVTMTSPQMSAYSPAKVWAGLAKASSPSPHPSFLLR